MSDGLMDLHRMLTESVARDEAMLQQLRTLNGGADVAGNAPVVPANLDLERLVNALVERMEDSIEAIEDVQAVLEPVDINNNVILPPVFEDDDDDE